MLEEGVVGEDKGVDLVCDGVVGGGGGMKDGNRRMGSLLLLGASGVGKSELAKSVGG